MTLLNGWNQRNTKAWYVITSILLLCVLQPLFRLYKFDGTFPILLTLALFALLLVQIAVDIGSRRPISSLSLYVQLCIFYACMVAGIGFIHMGGMLAALGLADVNAQHMSVKMALDKELRFTFAYLFFPVMLLGQYVFLRRLDFRWVLRAMGAIAGISASVAIYQRFIDPAFLHSHFPVWVGRYEGLATDPNALGLMMFLSIPLAIAGIRVDKGPFVRAGYLVLLFLLLFVEWGTKSRTPTGGTVLFLLLLPVLWVWSERRRWSIRKRVLMIISPILALGVVILALQSMPHKDDVTKSAGSRLANTLHKYEMGGISAVFFHDEARGRLFKDAIGLIELSPVAGWGPDGFYREHSNYILYSHSYPTLKGTVHGIPALEYYFNNRIVNDSPLNHYLVIACDFGIPMMLLNLIIIILPLVLGLIVLSGVEDDGQRFMAWVLVASDAVFLLIINTQAVSYFFGVLWVWTAQLAMLMVMVERRGIRFDLASTVAGKYSLIAISTIVAVVVLVGSYHMAFGPYGYHARLTSPWWTASKP